MATRSAMVIAWWLLSGSASASAQDPMATASDTASRAHRQAWVTRADGYRVGASLIALAGLSPADEGVAKASQRLSLHGNEAFDQTTEAIQRLGDPGAVLIAVSLYATGRLTHRPLLADASKHAALAIALSGAATQSLKLSTGRARPNVTHDNNAYVFLPFRGGKTDYNAFPSGHTTAAFATAAVFSAELARSHRRAARVVAPVLYGVAAAVGGARIYHNRHWLSDVAAGALIGTATGRRIVTHAHDRR